MHWNRRKNIWIKLQTYMTRDKNEQNRAVVSHGIVYAVQGDSNF